MRFYFCNFENLRKIQKYIINESGGGLSRCMQLVEIMSHSIGIVFENSLSEAYSFKTRKWSMPRQSSVVLLGVNLNSKTHPCLAYRCCKISQCNYTVRIGWHRSKRYELSTDRSTSLFLLGKHHWENKLKVNFVYYVLPEPSVNWEVLFLQFQKPQKKYKIYNLMNENILEASLSDACSQLE